jgi:prepilin-type N-terminal cleavage/methylation domain-containing protein
VKFKSQIPKFQIPNRFLELWNFGIWCFKNEDGFSLLELITATLIIGILALTVSNFYVDRLIDYARTDTILILQSNTKQALETMQKDIRAARTIETTNQWSDPNGPGGNPTGWTSSTGSPSTLVLAVPATDASGNLLYIDSAHSSLQTNDVIYYVDSSKKALYRRVVANPVTGNAAKSTCPPALATASCPADGKVIEDVANLVAAYYDTNNNPTSVVNNVYSVDITLTQSRYKFGRTYSNSFSTRTTLRNKP